MNLKDLYMINLEKQIATPTLKGLNLKVLQQEELLQVQTITPIREPKMSNIERNISSRGIRAITMKVTSLKMISTISTQGINKVKRKQRTSSKISSKSSGTSHQEEGVVQIINGSITIQMRISIGLALLVLSKITKEGLLIQMMIGTKIKVSNIVDHSMRNLKTIPTERITLIQEVRVRKLQKRKRRKMNSTDNTIMRTIRRNLSRDLKRIRRAGLRVIQIGIGSKLGG